MLVNYTFKVQIVLLLQIVTVFRHTTVLKHEFPFLKIIFI